MFCVYVSEKDRKGEKQSFPQFEQSPHQEALCEWHDHIRSQEAKMMETLWWQVSQEPVTTETGVKPCLRSAHEKHERSEVVQDDGNVACEVTSEGNCDASVRVCSLKKSHNINDNINMINLSQCDGVWDPGMGKEFVIYVVYWLENNKVGLNFTNRSVSSSPYLQKAEWIIKIFSHSFEGNY